MRQVRRFLRIALATPSSAGPARRFLPFEGKQIFHRHAQPPRHPLQSLEGRRVPATLDQTEEIDRYVEEFREALLRHAAAEPNLPQSLTELLSQGGHLEWVSKRESVVVWLRAPQNGVMGGYGEIGEA